MSIEVLVDLYCTPSPVSPQHGRHCELKCNTKKDGGWEAITGTLLPPLFRTHVKARGIMAAS